MRFADSSLAICISLLLLISGCATSQPDRKIANSDEASLEAFFFPIRLVGLGDPHFYFGKPDEACLQKFIDGKIAESKEWAKTTKNKEVLNYKGDPELAKNIIASAIEAGVDPYIFAGLVHQESGDFIPHKNGGGSGLTALTSIAIQDTCLTLEAVDCRKGGYKPEKYAAAWETSASDILAVLFPNSNATSEYPWRKFCSPPPRDFCSSTCGIPNGSDCLRAARNGVYKNNRTSLFMGAYSLMNQVANALTTGKETGATLKSRYLIALENYNGHPEHKKAYPGNVMTKVNSILKACPVAVKPENITQIHPPR